MKHFILLCFCVFATVFTFATKDRQFLDSRTSLFFKNMELTVENILKEKDRLSRTEEGLKIIEAVYGRSNNAWLTPRKTSDPLFAKYYSHPKKVQTLMMKAIELNHLGIVRFLIEDKALVSPEEIASSMSEPERFEIFKTLIRHYHSKNPNINSLVFLIDFRNHPEHSRTLLSELVKLDVNLRSIKKNKNNWSLLSLAVYSINPYATKFLLKQGLNPHAVDKEGNTLFHILIKGLIDRSKEVDEFLLHNQRIHAARIAELALSLKEVLFTQNTDLNLKNKRDLTFFEEMNAHTKGLNENSPSYSILSLFKSSFFFNYGTNPTVKKDYIQNILDNFDSKNIEQYQDFLIENYSDFNSAPLKTYYLKLLYKVHDTLEKENSKHFLNVLVENFNQKKKEGKSIQSTLSLASLILSNTPIEKFQTLVNSSSDVRYFIENLLDHSNFKISHFVNSRNNCRQVFPNLNR